MNMRTMIATPAFLAVAIFALSAQPVTSQETPAADPAEWKNRVTAAKAIADETERRDAMLALVRDALGGKEVRPSGNTHPDQVHPDDNEPAPVVNFDVRMNEKTSYATNGVLLATSPAYYLVSRGTPYIVLGPRSLDERSAVFTQMAAEHELFHAKHHVGDPRPGSDRELETWTHLFVTFFHDIAPFRQRWAPLVGTYEEAGRGERQAALDKLVVYYRNPPSSTVVNVREEFDAWLVRRQKDDRTASAALVADLTKAVAAAAAE